MASIVGNIEVLKSGLPRLQVPMSQQQEAIAALDLLGDFLMRVASISISLQKIEENTRRGGRYDRIINWDQVC